MSDGIDELDDVIQRAGATPWGKTCSALWAQAAVMAEERGDLAKAVRCYGELCAAYMMGGESTRVIAPFMWLDRMFKTRPDLFTENDIMALGWYYKYVISTVRCVPTVPVAQCEALLDEMRQYYVQQGDSMRAYHIRSYLFHRDMGEFDKAEDSYVKWGSAEHSELSDCQRCDPGYEVLYYSRLARWDEAVAAGDKALAVEGDFCDSQPEALLTEMLEPWLRVGRDSEAWAAHIRAYRRYQQAPRYFEFLQNHFMYLALSGRTGRTDRLERGLTILARHMPWWKEAEHPRVLMDTAASVVVLLDSFQGHERLRELPVTLPGEDLPWAARERVENPTIERAAQWMRDLALDLADQFDARPGHRAPGSERARVEALMDPMPVPLVQGEGLLHDVTGLGDYRSSLTFIHSPGQAGQVVSEAGHAGEGVHADEALSADEPVEELGADPLSLVTLAAPDGSVSAQGSQEPSGEEEEPALIPLELHGDWENMTPLELLRQSWTIITGADTVYMFRLRTYFHQHPEQLEAFINSLPADLENAGQYLERSFSVGSTLHIDEHESDTERSTSDAAYLLVVQAEALIAEGKLMEAAQTADQAMRVPSMDPHGVRLGTLPILGLAAQRAGYMEEAIESYRDVTNMCALLGFKAEQIVFSWVLARVLLQKRRWIEAAEVVQNALDLLEQFPHLWAHRVRLLDVGAQANEKLGYFDTAGAYHFQAATIVQEHAESFGAVKAYTEAAAAFAQAHDFVRRIDSAAAVPALLEQIIAGLCTERELADPDDVAGMKELNIQLSSTYDSYVAALNEYASAIVAQPGNVSAADIERMENIMQVLHGVVTDPALDEFLSQTVQWRHADWLSDMAFMYWQAYQYSTAMDMQRSSIAEFEKLNDVESQAQRVMNLAYMHNMRQEYQQARECAERVLTLMDDKKFVGHELKRNARKLLKNMSDDTQQD